MRFLAPGLSDATEMISVLTTRENGNLASSKSVDFWYFRISRKATVPGLYRPFFRPPCSAADKSVFVSVSQPSRLTDRDRPWLLASRRLSRRLLDYGLALASCCPKTPPWIWCWCYRSDHCERIARGGLEPHCTRLPFLPSLSRGGVCPAWGVNEIWPLNFTQSVDRKRSPRNLVVRLKKAL